MDKFYEKRKLFSQESLTAAIQVWNRTVISLIDIRHNLISPEEPLLNYRLPAGAFLYTSGGTVEVVLNDTAYSVDRFGLFHGGKGTMLTLIPRAQWTEYYMILYKPGEPPTRKREYVRLLESVNPFSQLYGFIPDNPVFLSELLRKMYEKWKGPTPLNLFYGKSAFYQLICEIYEELDQGHIPILYPDIVAMAKRFIDSSYAKSISIQDMADAFNVSYSHLYRIFSRQTGKSPQEYLMTVRLNASKTWLENSELSMREIARGTGFSDEHHFNRMFARHIGISPGEYRKKMTMDRIDYTLGNLIPFPYNEKGRVSVDKLKEKGANFMFKQIRNKSVIAAALSLMLLSGCSTAPSNTSGAVPAPSVAGQVTETDTVMPVEENTRTIHMDYGDVEIPADPQRVVVIFVQGDLLALGVTPVATSFNDDATFENQAKEITVIDAFSINEEEIMALDPDLILWNTKDESVYQTLSKIAPTLAMDYFSMEYQERLRFFGEVLNRSEKAEELIQSFEDKVKEAKQTLEDKGLSNKSVLCIQNRKEGVLSAFWLGRGAPLLYEQLEFKVPEKLQEAIKDHYEDGAVDLSFEVISEYNSDYILVNGTLDNFENSEVWKTLPAVKENHIIVAPSNMFWYNDILTMNAQIDLILDSILDTSANN